MLDSTALQARTDAFADLAIRFVEGLPDVARIRRLALQFQDASTSVGANYRAARHAKSKADFTSKIGTVSGEADEAVYWLRRMRNGNIESQAVPLGRVLDEAEQLARIFGAAHRTASRRGNRRIARPADDPMTTR